MARARMARPTFIVAGGPVPALDGSVQAQIPVPLASSARGDRCYLPAYQPRFGDRTVCVCKEVMVMDAGAVAERGRTDDIFDASRDGYTRVLFDAVLPEIG